MNYTSHEASVQQGTTDLESLIFYFAKSKYSDANTFLSGGSFFSIMGNVVSLH